MRSAIAGCGTQIVDCDADWQMSWMEDVSDAKPNWSACAKLEEAKEAGAKLVPIWLVNSPGKGQGPWHWP